ncbi:MAG: argininosuccinate lyase [Candidatus Sumerlaeota bacterium]|nr:argininosuccinate lyase [Candidatus Sumerlaeota bacterium]
MALKTFAREVAPVWRQRMAAGPDTAMLAYCAGRDVVAKPAADERLIPYDLWTNRAHTLMLAKCNLIPKPLAAKILRALDRIENQAARGAFALDPDLEDVHIAIEAAVTRIAGAEAGGRIHTARSRNDQSATDMRLWLREACLRLRGQTLTLIGALISEKREDALLVIPGYTHAQPAALTTWGHWLQCWAQALARDAARLAQAYQRINQSPLGAAASFGATWPIDRRLAARLLGFASVQDNTLDCISSRWEMEADLGQAVAFLMTHLSQMGQDLIAFSTPPGDILRLDDRFTTGSSIMPQKRNPDFAEVTRARAAAAASLAHTLLEVARGSRSGYNRDTQWTKYWIMDLADEAENAPMVFAEAIRTLRFNEPVRRAMIARGFMNAVDVADHLARTRNAPFRACYQILAETVRLSQSQGALDFAALNALIEKSKLGAPLNRREIASLSDPQQCVARRRHQGAPSPEALKKSRKLLTAEWMAGCLELARDRNPVREAQDNLKREIARFIHSPQ